MAMPTYFISGKPDAIWAIDDLNSYTALVVDLEGDLSPSGKLSLIQVNTNDTVYIFDLFTQPAIMEWGLGEVLKSDNILKIMHDCRQDSRALWGQFHVRLTHVIDSQLAYKHFYNTKRMVGLNKVLETCTSNKNTLKDDIRHRPGLWERRPLSDELLSYAAQDVMFLLDACENMGVFQRQHIKQLLQVTSERIKKSLMSISPKTNADSITMKFTSISPTEHAKVTARAFYSYLHSNPEERKLCCDKFILRDVYMNWRKEVEVPDNAPGTKYRGAFSAILYNLKRSKKIVKQSDKDVILWKIDCTPQLGQTSPNMCNISDLAAQARGRRVELESDRNGIRIGPLEYDNILEPKLTCWRDVLIENVGETSQNILGAGLCDQSTGSQIRLSLNHVVVPYTLKPGDKIHLRVECTPLRGVLRNIINIIFDGFNILRYVHVVAGDAQLHELLKPIAEFKRYRKKKRSVLPSDLAGEKPQGGVRWKQDIADYKSPRDLTRMIADGSLAQKLKDYSFSTNYTDFLQNLLWVEELQMSEDLSTYSMDNAILSPVQERGRKLYRLVLPGLSEGRPSVLRGDKLFVLCQNKKYIGFVWQVERDAIKLHLHSNFSNHYVQGLNVGIEFVLNRTLLKLQHHHLVSNLRRLPKEMFHPPSQVKSYEPLQPLDLRKDQYNDKQIQAITHIVNGKRNCLPYIVYGPPGTGKTHTIVEAIAQAIKRNPKSILKNPGSSNFRILACAPSNYAADLLCERLSKQLNKSTMFRAIAYSRRDPVPDRIRKYCMRDEDGNYLIPDELDKYRIVVTTLGTASKLQPQLGITEEVSRFDMIFIDEAGHATEPEICAAVLALLKVTGRLVLSGDPKQLGPIIHADLAREYGLGRSLLERLSMAPIYDSTEESNCSENYYNPFLITKLIENYRSHPDILCLPNKQFYKNELLPMGDPVSTHSLCHWDGLPTKGVPLKFVGVQGENTREASSPSWFNISEIAIVLEHVRLLLESKKYGRVTPEDIGIIAPYQKQVQKIRQAIDGLGPQYSKGIMVGSTEQFQGQEKKVIIISTVRSSVEWIKSDVKHSIGFLSNPKRYNVAITRAKALLIIIGNPNVLAVDPMWRELLRYCMSKKAYVGDEFTLPDQNDGGEDDSDDDSDDDFCDVGGEHVVEEHGGDDEWEILPSVHGQEFGYRDE